MLELIETWGYVAVFAGAFFEGETVLIIGGFLASGGHLELASVILSGFLGGLAGDQFFFYVGRARGRRLIERRESWRPRLQRIEGILERHGTLLMLGYRFMYGVRLVTPLVLGAFGVARLRFLVLNLINAAVWSALIASLGYAFGQVVAQMVRAGAALRAHHRHPARARRPWSLALIPRARAPSPCRRGGDGDRASRLAPHASGVSPTRTSKKKAGSLGEPA
jgi:membrane protein DedA with SNARE-associated domain